MKLSRLLSTDLKETLKKIRYKYQNRNFVPYIVEKTLFKTDFKFYVANLDAQNWYLDEESVNPETKEWMWPELEFVKNNITKTGDIVLECGGHHGLTAVVIAKWIGSTGHVYTFEPIPPNSRACATAICRPPKRSSTRRATAGCSSWSTTRTGRMRATSSSRHRWRRPTRSTSWRPTAAASSA